MNKSKGLTLEQGRSVGLSFYGTSIVNATGCHVDDAEAVEEEMRYEYSTLDHLDNRRFNAAAKRAYRAVLDMREGVK